MKSLIPEVPPKKRTTGFVDVLECRLSNKTLKKLFKKKLLKILVKNKTK